MALKNQTFEKSRTLEEFQVFFQDLFENVCGIQQIETSEVKEKFFEKFLSDRAKKDKPFNYFENIGKAVLTTNILLRHYFRNFFSFAKISLNPFKDEVKLLWKHWLKNRSNIFVKCIDTLAIIADAFLYDESDSLDWKDASNWFIEWFQGGLYEEFYKSGDWKQLHNFCKDSYNNTFEYLRDNNFLTNKYLVYNKPLLDILKQSPVMFPVPSKMIAFDSINSHENKYHCKKIVYLRIRCQTNESLLKKEIEDSVERKSETQISMDSQSMNTKNVSSLTDSCSLNIEHSENFYNSIPTDDVLPQKLFADSSPDVTYVSENCAAPNHSEKEFSTNISKELTQICSNENIILPMDKRSDQFEDCLEKNNGSDKQYIKFQVCISLQFDAKYAKQTKPFEWQDFPSESVKIVESSSSFDKCLPLLKAVIESRIKNADIPQEHDKELTSVAKMQCSNNIICIELNSNICFSPKKNSLKSKDNLEILEVSTTKDFHLKNTEFSNDLPNFDVKHEPTHALQFENQQFPNISSKQCSNVLYDSNVYLNSKSMQHIKDADIPFNSAASEAFEEQKLNSSSYNSSNISDEKLKQNVNIQNTSNTNYLISNSYNCVDELVLSDVYGRIIKEDIPIICFHELGESNLSTDAATSDKLELVHCDYTCVFVGCKEAEKQNSPVSLHEEAKKRIIKNNNPAIL